MLFCTKAERGRERRTIEPGMVDELKVSCSKTLRSELYCCFDLFSSVFAPGGVLDGMVHSHGVFHFSFVSCLSSFLLLD